MSSRSSAHEQAPPEPDHAQQRSQTPTAPLTVSAQPIGIARSPGLRLCAQPRSTGEGDPSDHSALSQSAPTSPLFSRPTADGTKAPAFLLIPPGTQIPSPRTASPGIVAPRSPIARPRTGSIGGIGSALRGGRDPRPPVFADLLRSPQHQRALSVNSHASPTSGMHVPSGLERASSSSSSSHRQSRRCSVAVSTNLSITQGLPIDPDQLDMDESDGYLSCDTPSGHESDDSMDLDATGADSISLVSAARRNSRHEATAAQEVGSAGSTPRNKAFERLRSLVEEDKQALASEMEHEGQITRSIRHSSVQEWLRRSSSAGLASPGPPNQMPGLHQSNGTSPRPDDTAMRLPSASAAKLPRPVPVRAQEGGPLHEAHDSVPVPFPPPSPASSLASSPSSLAALAAPPFALPPHPALLGTPSHSTGSPSTCSSNKKRKAEDDGSTSGDADDPATPLAYHAHKRQAMSPSGLRVQLLGMSNAGRRVILAPTATKSGPASPLLGSVSRPVAVPAFSRHHQQHSIGASGSLLPSAMNSGPVNRVRSRSGATPVGASSGGYYGASANVMQTNGVFSRMDISDKKHNSSHSSQPQ